jgi:hypothetical protein
MQGTPQIRTQVLCTINARRQAESVGHFVLNLKIQESDFSKFETRQLIEPARTGLITVTVSLIVQQIQ